MWTRAEAEEAVGGTGLNSRAIRRPVMRWNGDGSLDRWISTPNCCQGTASRASASASAPLWAQGNKLVAHGASSRVISARRHYFGRAIGPWLYLQYLILPGRYASDQPEKCEERQCGSMYKVQGHGVVVAGRKEWVRLGKNAYGKVFLPINWGSQGCCRGPREGICLLQVGGLQTLPEHGAAPFWGGGQERGAIKTA